MWNIENTEGRVQRKIGKGGNNGNEMQEQQYNKGK
jgi:hypothetical protein